jgi:hypothetical protein
MSSFWEIIPPSYRDRWRKEDEAGQQVLATVSAIVSAGGRAFYIADDVVALDAATGETLRTYQGTAGTEEIIVQHGTLFRATKHRTATSLGGGLRKDRGWG